MFVDLGKMNEIYHPLIGILELVKMQSLVAKCSKMPNIKF